jgi:hypothetical protein
MITGLSVATDCWSEVDGERETRNTFLYIADVSVAGGEVRTLLFKNAELTGVDLVDIDGDGTQDLMATMTIYGETTQKLRIYGMDIESGNPITNRTYLVSQQ